MISFRKLTIKPHSPDRVLEQSSIAESALARIAHVNWLGREVYDVKLYEIDLDGTITGSVKIKSRKGIVKIINADPTEKTLTLSLENGEIEEKLNQFWIQTTVFCDSSSIAPIIIVRDVNEGSVDIEIKNLETDAADWENLYFYYDVIKID